jgi:hypothetical protein
VIFRGLALVRHIVICPTPNRYAQAPQVGHDRKEIAVDWLEGGQIEIGEPSDVPFARPEASVFEIAITRSIRCDEHIVKASISVKRNVVERVDP